MTEPLILTEENLEEIAAKTGWSEMDLRKLYFSAYRLGQLVVVRLGMTPTIETILE